MTTEPSGGSSPPPSESSGGEGLFGTTTSGKPRRRAWRIEINGLGPGDEGRSLEIRVALVDAETGKRVAAQRLPFSWIVDVATGGQAAITLHEGDWS